MTMTDWELEMQAVEEEYWRRVDEQVAVEFDGEGVGQSG
jgi:hypothetical protein